MIDPDIVIPVRVGERNPELRYALRSLRYLPHGRVWIVGYQPSWVTGVRHIDVPQTGTKQENAAAALQAACREPEVWDSFVLWNDDFFLLEPLDRVPVLDCGSLDEYIAERTRRGGGPYMRSLRATAAILRALGHPKARCHELHTPMPMRKRAVLWCYDAAAGIMPVLPQIKTLYGNLSAIQSERAQDAKVYRVGRPWEPVGPFLSTCDAVWPKHSAAQHVMNLFPDPGPYEVEAS